MGTRLTCIFLPHIYTFVKSRATPRILGVSGGCYLDACADPRTVEGFPRAAAARGRLELFLTERMRTIEPERTSIVPASMVVFGLP